MLEVSSTTVSLHLLILLSIKPFAHTKLFNFFKTWILLSAELIIFLFGRENSL